MRTTCNYLLLSRLVMALCVLPGTASAEGWKVYAADGQGHFGWAARPVDSNSHISIAAREASLGCQQTSCRVVMSVTAQCMAFAESRMNGYWYGHAFGPDIGTATANAVRFCKDPSCRVIHSFCS